MSGAGATKGWSRQRMADRLAAEFRDGWIVNLGVGIPTLCSNTDTGDRDVVFHSENGVIGYGPVLPEGQEDLHLVNAGGQNVSLRPGAANGDFANWKVAANAKGGGIGGAMDLASCARRVFLLLEHTTRRGAPRLVRRCALPVTARRVVTLIATNFGLFEPAGEAFRVLELAPGMALEEVRAATGAPVTE